MFEDDRIKETSDIEMMKDNRFVVRFPKEIGIQEWTVRSCQRPSVEVIYSDDKNNRDIIGYKWKPIKMTLLNLFGKNRTNNNKKIMDWFMSHINYVFHAKKDYGGCDIYIEMLDQFGCIVEKWLLSNCIVQSADFGTCNYNKDRMSKTTIIIQPKNCSLVDLES